MIAPAADQPIEGKVGASLTVSWTMSYVLSDGTFHVSAIASDGTPYDLGSTPAIFAEDNYSLPCIITLPTGQYQIKVTYDPDDSETTLSGTAAGSLAVTDPTPTHVSGAISQDTTWTPAGSPYVLDGTVTVSPGVTLPSNPVSW